MDFLTIGKREHSPDGIDLTDAVATVLFHVFRHRKNIVACCHETCFSLDGLMMLDLKLETRRGRLVPRDDDAL